MGLWVFPEVAHGDHSLGLWGMGEGGGMSLWEAFSTSSFETGVLGFCSQVRHKNLVQLVGLVLNGSQVNSIIMELMGKV